MTNQNVDEVNLSGELQDNQPEVITSHGFTWVPNQDPPDLADTITLIQDIVYGGDGYALARGVGAVFGLITAEDERGTAALECIQAYPQDEQAILWELWLMTVKSFVHLQS